MPPHHGAIYLNVENGPDSQSSWGTPYGVPGSSMNVLPGLTELKPISKRPIEFPPVTATIVPDCIFAILAA